MASFDPGLFSGDDAAELMDCFGRIERLASAGKAMAAARATECGMWRRSGARSAAEWMGHQTGCSAREAATQLETAKRMQRLGEAADAYRRGELSPPVAAAVAAGASADRASEQELLATARSEPVEVVKARAAESVRRAAGDDRLRSQRLWRSRSLRTWRDADGAHITQLRLPPELGALFGAGWRRYLHDARLAARDRQERCHPDMLAADAAVMMAQHRCGPGSLPSSTATDVDPAAAQHRCRPTRGAEVRHASAATGTELHSDLDRVASGGTWHGEGERRRAPAQVLARVDLEALLRGHAEGGEVCEIAGVGPVPVSAIENLLGSATLALVLTRGVDVLNVTHLGRAATPHQRSALGWRDPACVVEGCDEQLDLEIDHVTGWQATRSTRLDDLARLCHDHHARKTHQGWTLTPPDPATGKRKLIPPAAHDTS